MTVELGVITWNMAGGNPDYSSNFLGGIDSFFEDYYAAENLDPKTCQVICVQEVMSSRKNSTVTRFAARGYPFVAYVTRKKQKGDIQFWDSDETEGQAIFSSLPISARRYKTIIGSGSSFWSDGTWQRKAQVAQIDIATPGGLRRVPVCHYHNTNEGGTAAKRMHMAVCEQWLTDVRLNEMPFSQYGDKIVPTDPWVLAGDFNLKEDEYTPFDVADTVTLSGPLANLARPSARVEAFRDALRYSTVDYVDWQVSSMEKVSRHLLGTSGRISDHDAIFVQYRI